MSDSIFRKCSTIFLLTVSSLLAAQEAPVGDNCMACVQREGCCVPSCRPYEFYAWGSFIFWQPIQENMSLGVDSDNSATLDLVNGKEIDLDFDFEPGFKVGLGYHFCYDNWDTSLEYTWLRAEESKSKSVASDNDYLAIYPAWQIPSDLNPRYDGAKLKWELDLDFLDWDFARTCSCSDSFTLRPFFGIRGARIDQSAKVDYTNTEGDDVVVWTSTSIKHTSDSWGIGPRIGLLTNWTFCNGFRIYAEQELDVLYTTYDLKFHQVSDGLYPSKYSVKHDNDHHLRTHLDLGLGLGWGTCLSACSWIDFSAEYRFQVFFDQNTFRAISSNDSVGRGVVPNGNLYMHGLIATVRFDF